MGDALRDEPAILSDYGWQRTVRGSDSSERCSNVGAIGYSLVY
jgi:hypothetical protein